jgi:bla regulator protein BlaR1
MNAMWNQLANHLWQSTLFAMLIAGLCLLLKRDGAHIRYWLWWLASLKFLLPFSLLTGLGNWLGLRTEIGSVPDAWTATATVVATPFAADAAAVTPGMLLVLLWATGAMVCLVLWWKRARRLRHVLNAAIKDPVPLRHRCLTVDVYRTDEPIEPGVVGIWRCVLLLPRGLQEQLRKRQFDAVVAHELCHIERRDNLSAAGHMLVEALFWFHPVVWWIGARLVEERERACDEMVVTLGHDRQIYAESILDVCAQYVATPLHCAAGISGSDLKLRITQIMRYPGMRKLKRVKKCILGGSALLALAVPLLAGLMVQQQAVAQDPVAPAVPAVEPPLNPSIERIPNPPDPNPAATPQDGGEYLPIVRVAPVYPPRAAARGIEGYVVVQYTVSTDGTTKDVRVLESSSTLFERSAIESAQKYRYRPRIIDNTPVEVAGVTTRIEYALEPPSDPGAASDTAVD